ncbi:MAG: hypothetical protein MUP85_11670 [Candidatus Lokiarchaeota archaeon]|nr:hypothetical protein [Candidatus Lokiarchaeota archaeon]
MFLGNSFCEDKKESRRIDGVKCISIVTKNHKVGCHLAALSGIAGRDNNAMIAESIGSVLVLRISIFR